MRRRASLGVLVLSLAGGCEEPPTRDSSPPPDAPAPAHAAGGEPTAGASAVPAAPPAWRAEDGTLRVPEHWTPGPARSAARRDPAARLASELECRRCHPAAAHEWAGSQHAGAWSDAAFQRAFTVEPRAFCQRCHAPEEDPGTPTGEVSAAAATLGVGCVTCHVEPGTAEVWAPPRSDAASADALAPHPIARSVAMAGPAACASCHEFGFPDNALREHPLAMQSTVTEHQGSDAADRACASCHMPATEEGRRSHAFAGAYDRGMLARSLDVEATRPAPTQIVVRLAPGEVGHAVPTGDLLRRLMVEVTIEGEEGTPEYRAHRYYGRRFAPVRQGQGITLRGQLEDDRVGIGRDGGIRRARFTIPDDLAARPVRWRVVHQRVALASTDPRRAPVEGQLDMARGTLAAKATATAG